MTTRRQFLKTVAGSTATATLSSWKILPAREKSRPNILWISTEDIGPHLGCYGDPHAVTPTLDGLAAKGVLYKNAFTTAGVCAPNRSSIITGVYPTTLGTHPMRTGGSGVERSIPAKLPKNVRFFTEYIREAGYYCTNNSKTDYQVKTPKDAWDESSNTAHWKNRPHEDTPFFAVFNYKGTHEGSVRSDPERFSRLTRRLTPEQRQDADQLTTLPPFHPDTPIVRRQWQKYYELLTGLDYWVQDLLNEVEQAGLADNTIVVFWSDHGTGMTRCKRWIYDSGTHIPLIVYIPEKYRTHKQAQPGTVDEQLVSSLDLPPTMLNMLGLDIPDYVQGRAFLGSDLSPERNYVYAARDRMDERYDIIRMVRDKRYLYLRNYEPFKPYYQHMRSAEKDPVIKELRRLHVQGKLYPAAEQFMSDHKPVEELYDTQNDPHQIYNLADDPQYQAVLQRLRKEHYDWIFRTGDLGLIPEPELVKYEKQYGDRYSIWSHPENQGMLERLHAVASVAGHPHITDIPLFIHALGDEKAPVRYWALVGLGNLADKASYSKERILNDHLRKDRSAVVRIAAARYFNMLEDYDTALPVLLQELQNEQEWVRLYAAIELDRINEQAREVIPQLKQALQDKHNKYVVRVANNALNELLGMDNMVR